MADKFLKRPMHCLGIVLLGFLSSIPGMLILLFGIHGLHSGQISTKRGSLLTGAEAASYSWVLIGIGIWALCLLGTFFQRWPILRMFGYILSAGAVLWGITVLVRRIFGF
ncbi:MAG: hypothetical protein WDM80_06475 [Limisphaerales bacterium]